MDLARHLILPVLCLAYGSLAYLTRFTRANVLEGLRSEYITAGRARGLPERVLIWRHALRNAAVPLLTLVGVLVPALLGGSVLVETVFSWPGMGRLYFDALQNRDHPVILGLTALAALAKTSVPGLRGNGGVGLRRGNGAVSSAPRDIHDYGDK